jgi:hypothetical protein
MIQGLAARDCVGLPDPSLESWSPAVPAVLRSAARETIPQEPTDAAPSSAAWGCAGYAQWQRKFYWADNLARLKANVGSSAASCNRDLRLSRANNSRNAQNDDRTKGNAV